MIKNTSEVKCNPLNSVREIQDFLLNPPAWRSLCVDLQPHSKYQIKNSELIRNRDVMHIELEKTPTFCHFDPDDEDDNVRLARFEGHSLPKTLVCHDMANGYHDDSAVDGTGNHTAYSFYHWAGIDIFCYFSHHLVTVPPLGWINVAHAHGVKVIGTVITEWGEGTIFWDDVLSSEGKLQNFISVLVTIAKTLKFDGWLLNIENKVSEPQKLVEFVQGLHQMLHQELPHATLVWYDSVTSNGQLNWQNQLNAKNKVFFDACDGFFTNYSWIPSDLDDSVTAAGERRHDLFIGMDVWGRNFYGGGMFNLQEAMKMVFERGCSVAIFAPAWTREALADSDARAKEGIPSTSLIEMGQDLSTLERFLLRDRALWDSIWPFLTTRLPSRLPFQTSFCVGQGERRRLYGEVLCPVPWYNLRHQHYQLNSAHGPHGYLLSTQEKLQHASRLAIADKTGIMKYREHLYRVAETADTDDDDESDDEVPRRDSPRNLSADRDLDSPRDSSAKKRKYSAPEAQADPSVQYSLHLHEPSIRLRLSEGQTKTRLQLAFVPNELPCVEVYFEDSFIGGSCVKLNPTDRVSERHRFSRLFHCDFEADGALVACVVTKRLAEAPSQYLTVHLYCSAASGPGGADSLVVLVCRPLAHAPSAAPGHITVYPENKRGSFKELQAYLLLSEPGFYVPVENAFGWDVWYFLVPLEGRSRVSSVNCLTGCMTGALLLGHFALCSKSEAQSAAAPAPEPPLPAAGRISLLEIMTKARRSTDSLNVEQARPVPTPTPPVPTPTPPVPTPTPPVPTPTPPTPTPPRGPPECLFRASVSEVSVASMPSNVLSTVSSKPHSTASVNCLKNKFQSMLRAKCEML